MPNQYTGDGVYTQVLAYVQEYGPVSAPEVAEHFKLPRDYARGYLGQHKKYGRIHIARYEYTNDYGWYCQRAFYAFGPGKDAKRLPKLPSGETRKRYVNRKRKQVNSVFQLGQCAEYRGVNAKLSVYK